MGDFRTDEDKIIEDLALEGNNKFYVDTDFLPIRQSLYNVKNIIADYDAEICSQFLWCRPHEICTIPEYFFPSTSFHSICCRQGTLPVSHCIFNITSKLIFDIKYQIIILLKDEVFLGTLMAICVFPGRELIENIFGSRQDDFKKFGVYTCRFYVEGEWVEVVTDTSIPCIRDEFSNKCTPIYGSSANPNEVWIALAEKAYAKAVGSYEAIQKVRIHEALLHLTGGSVQQLFLRDDSGTKEASGNTWKILNKHLRLDTMIVLLPDEKLIQEAIAKFAEETELRLRAGVLIR